MKVKYFAVHNDFNASTQYERGANFIQGSEPYLLQILLNMHVFPYIGPTYALLKSSFPVTNTDTFHSLLMLNLTTLLRKCEQRSMFRNLLYH
jgi:hypothetical protein